MRLTKEERIRRLQEQIRRIENDQPANTNLVYENDHFYVRKYGWRSGEKFLRVYFKSRATLNNEKRTHQAKGYELWYKGEIEDWLADAEKMVEYIKQNDE